MAFYLLTEACPLITRNSTLCGHGNISLLLQQIDDTGNVTVVVDWHALTLEKALALVVGVRRVRDWANLQWAWIRRLVKIVLHV